MNLKKINIFNRNIDVYQQVIDYAVPVNFVYVQYPQQKKPEDLYPNTTWEVIDYQGCFFRAEGGSASTFVEEGGTLTKQGYQNAYHNHTHSHTHTLSHTHSFNHRHKTTTTVGYSGTTVSFWFDARDVNGTSALPYGSVICDSSGLSASRKDADYVACDDATGSGGHAVGHFAYSGGNHNHSGTGTSDYPINPTNTTYNNTTSGANTSTTSNANTTSTSYDGSSTVKEARPDNYTIKVWKRTA